MRTETPELDGWWIATEGQLGGVPLPQEALTDLALRVSNGMFIFGTDAGHLSLNRHAHPQELDLRPLHGANAGRVVPGIVDVSPGSLRICCDLSGSQRPRDSGRQRAAGDFSRLTAGRWAPA